MTIHVIVIFVPVLFVPRTVFVPIICCKIKNPPTLHSTPKIQPITLATFIFSVFASVGKSGVMKKTVDSRFDRSSSCFF
jgi:hypothetical protein